MAIPPFAVRDEDAPVDTAPLQGLSLVEFLALPEVKPALEYEEGGITQKVPPQGQHSVLQLALCNLFNQAAVPRKVAYAFPELRATKDQRSYVPDVAVYAWNRIPRTPAGEVANRFSELPDVAVEIVSPEQGIASLIRKCIWFIEHGVRAALVVDPDDRSILVFRAGSNPAVARGTDEVDLSDVIPGFRLGAAAVFASLRFD